MRKILSWALVFLITAGALLIACNREGAAPDPTSAPKVAKIGEPAPDFELLNLEGDKVSLASFKGTPVMLNFWATWCGACVYEMPFLEQVYLERPEEDLAMLLINVGESPAKVQEFLKKNGYYLPVLLDTQRTATLMYRVSAYPTTVLIDKEGIVQSIIIGAFPDKETLDEKLKLIAP